MADSRRHFLRRCDIGARRNSHEQAFLFGEKFGRLIGLIIRYRQDSIQDRPVQNLRNKAGANALNAMGAGVPSRKDRRAGWLHRDDLDVGAPLFEHFATPGDGSTGADRGDDQPVDVGCRLRADAAAAIDRSDAG